MPRSRSSSSLMDRMAISWPLALSLGTTRKGDAGDVEAASAAETMEIVAPEKRRATEAGTTAAVVHMEVAVNGMAEAVKNNMFLIATAVPSAAATAEPSAAATAEPSATVTTDIFNSTTSSSFVYSCRFFLSSRSSHHGLPAAILVSGSAVARSTLRGMGDHRSTTDVVKPGMAPLVARH